MLFAKKEKVRLFTESQKEEFVEKLERAHVKYTLRIEKDDLPGSPISYLILLKSADLQKVG